MSWAADDRQLVMVDDGWGWIERPRNLFNNRLFVASGDPQNVRFDELPGYPDEPIWGSRVHYHGFGTLALDGRIYQFASAMGKEWWIGAKLIYSPDNGHTWCNQDGSTPVVWETAERQSHETLAFYDEPQSAFSLLTILQMGCNYSANRDGYVYIYSPNGYLEGTMNELVMLRAPKHKLLDRGAYEYFAGFEPSGNARWSSDIRARVPVHTFLRGWVNKTVSWHHPYAWHPSVVYSAQIGLYLMANWGMGCSPEGDWFSKPSYLGFWIARDPWGPWTQVHEETAWRPADDPKARAYQPQIAPKWIAKDGKSFWLVWTDWQQTPEFEPLMLKAMRAPDPEECVRLMREAKKRRPHYEFSTQRVDLLLG